MRSVGRRVRRGADGGARRATATMGRVTLALLGAALCAAPGCAGVFGFDDTSGSVGWHATGALVRPALLPVAGDGYSIGAPWRERDSNHGTDELVGAVVRAARAVARLAPGGTAAVGDLSRRGGGGSVEHRSHQSGRDVDVFYYAVNLAGRPLPPGDVMLHYDRSGRAVRWSPPKGRVAPKKPVPDARFDFRRNWAFIRALLQDPDVEVQWIFVQKDLVARLLQQSTIDGDDPALRARAAQVVKQPTDSEVHDDHMHIRIYCDPDDRISGCSDRGPTRWWKKGWKYMEPPFGRGASDDVTSALVGLLRGRVPVATGRTGSTS